MKDVITDLRTAWRRIHSDPGSAPSGSGAAAPDLDSGAKGPRAFRRPRTWLTVAALVALALVSTEVVRRRLASPAQARPIASLVVLPLQNLSGDPEQEYFADGLTEALIGDLAHIRALRVISRTSAMRYKNSTQSLPEIASALGVDAVVQGSVARQNGRVRITAQLIDGRTDGHLWSATYEREGRDVLTLQREMARSIAREVQVVLTPQEQAGLARVQIVDPEAHQLHLKGRYMWNKRTPEDLHKALKLFEASIAQDPSYAPPYSGLADVYSVLASIGLDAVAPRDVMPQARASAQRALALDPSLAEAHASLALVKLRYDWDPQGAEEEYKKAIELNPGYATAHQWYSECLSVLGRHDEALSEARWARDLDPLSLVMSHNVGRQLYYAHRIDEAIEESRKTLEMDEGFALARVMLGLELAAAGHADAAAHEFEASGSVLKGFAYGRAGRRKDALQTLAELHQEAQTTHVSQVVFMFLHLGLGDRDATLAALEQGFQERSDFMMYMGVDPIMDSVRDDPRFQDLLRRVRLAASTTP